MQGNDSDPALAYAASRSLCALRAFGGNVLAIAQNLVQLLAGPYHFAQEQAARQLWELGKPLACTMTALQPMCMACLQSRTVCRKCQPTPSDRLHRVVKPCSTA